MIAERFLITGRVQGVGFRVFVQRESARLALDGWVRNRGVDQVEATLSGSPAALDAFAVRAAMGPPAAKVTSVERQPARPEDQRLVRSGQGCALLGSV
ncbi:MAG TPA: acylphosphatase [Methylocystis sp.]|nr:acylphosphatase [Methylocystis sp.]HXZ18002.1 acylphosphatase [Roseiarcus sp.]